MIFLAIIVDLIVEWPIEPRLNERKRLIGLLHGRRRFGEFPLVSAITEDVN